MTPDQVQLGHIQLAQFMFRAMRMDLKYVTTMMQDIEGDDLGTTATQSLEPELYDLNRAHLAIEGWLSRAEQTLRERITGKVPHYEA